MLKNKMIYTAARYQRVIKKHNSNAKISNVVPDKIKDVFLDVIGSGDWVQEPKSLKQRFDCIKAVHPKRENIIDIGTEGGDEDMVKTFISCVEITARGLSLPGKMPSPSTILALRISGVRNVSCNPDDGMCVFGVYWIPVHPGRIFGTLAIEGEKRLYSTDLLKSFG